MVHGGSATPLYRPGVGDFSGEELKCFLQSKDYACLTGLGNVSNHVTFFCQAFGARVVGAMACSAFGVFYCN